MRDKRFYSLDIATQIGRISRGQATRWAKNGTFVPSILYWTKSRPYSYLYSFSDLVALRVISMLRSEYDVPLPKAFAAAHHIRATPNIPWSKMRFWVWENQVLLANPNNQVGTLIELEPIAASVHDEADELWSRSPDDYGKVERNRNIMHGALVVKGTRIPVSTVVALVDAGWDIDRIRRGYPTLQPEDIHGVIQYIEEQKQVA